MVPKIEDIEKMFAHVRQSGTDIDGELRWPFSFLGTDLDRLKEYSVELTKLGFVPTSPESNETCTVFRVCASRIVKHTPVSLYASLLAFQEDVETGKVGQLQGIDMRPANET
jgi:hypothetical protein